MERLWTPWRMEYLQADKPEGCIFCMMLAADDDKGCLVLHRGQQAFVVLNRYPYNNGHLMVVPFKHVSTLEDLDDDTLMELMLLTNKGMAALRETMSPDGFNIGGRRGNRRSRACARRPPLGGRHQFHGCSGRHPHDA